MKHLVIYRPSYSSAGDWKEDWFAIDLEDTTNNLLINPSYRTTALTSFWWLYNYSQYYQQITRYTQNMDDDPTTAPATLNSRKITYNIDDNSIDVTQDE